MNRIYSTTTVAERYAMLGEEGLKQNGPHLEELAFRMHFPNGRPGRPDKKPEPQKKPKPNTPKPDPKTGQMGLTF